MKINNNTEVDSCIPFQSIWGYKIEWAINQHAQLRLIGEINPEELDKLSKSHMGTGIELFFTDESGGKAETIFKGMVVSVRYQYEGGSCQAVINGTSCSKMLDINRASRSFQNVSKTYADISREVIIQEGGAIICTSGKNEIEKPLIRYQETAWEYVRRIAGLCRTYLIADIITGRPNVWFGMRKGVEIQENAGWDSVEVVKKHGKKGDGDAGISYQISSRNLYRIGDYKEIEGRICTVYNVTMAYDGGDLMFRYMLASERNLAVCPWHHESFIGLSLSGIVSKAEKEYVYIKLDIDGEDGMYPYPWRPETGNALYAMPEIGTPVSLYIPGADEREAFGLACLPWGGDSKYGAGNTALKELSAVSGGAISLFPDQMGIAKNGVQSLELLDGTGIEVSSSGKIRMEAEENVRLQAKRILIVVPGEIKAVVDER